MRTVFTNEMVAHVFANQSQARGRSANGNFSFEGTRLYSYSTVIAEFRVAVDGSRVLLRTSETFSITTSGKHETALNHALPDNVRVFHVPFLSRYDSEVREGSARLDQGNLDYLLDAGRRALAYGAKCPIANNWRAELITQESAGRYGDEPGESVADLTGAAAWPANPIPRFVLQAIQSFTEARDYAAAFGLTIEADLAAEVARTVTAWNARVAAYNSPAAVNRRAAEAARRERKAAEAAEAKRKAAEVYNLERFAAWVARGRIGPRPLAECFSEGSPERAELDAIQAAEREQRDREHKAAFDLWRAGSAPRPSLWRYPVNSPERAAIEAAEAAEKAAEHAEDLKAWRAGSTSVRYYGTDESGIGAALRLKGEMVETSRGAEVPLAHALKAFAFMRLIWQQGRTWRKNGHSLRVGHFTVDAIDSEKVRAGCHVLTRTEVERFAAEIGVADVQPDDSALTVTGRHV